MAIGIIGLPLSGKTTVFNAVTRGHADVAGFRAGGQQPNIGVVKVPDPRLKPLSDLAHSKRIVQAEIEYFDIPAAPEGIGVSRGIDGSYLNLLQRCDGLLLVARAFENAAVPSAHDAVDPYRDVEALAGELALSDLALLERRTERIGQQSRSAKAADRDALTREAALIATISEALEADVPVREQSLPPEAKSILENFQLLTAKPLVVLFNIGEEQVDQATALEAEMAQKLGRPGTASLTMPGKLEMELAQMEPADEAEFRESMGVGASALDRMVQVSYDLLGLMSFLTTGEDETRAWTIPKGTAAVDAAAKIHTDIQRGFIRAEVVTYDDLMRGGSIAETRRQGALRQEGKTYVVKDGDVVNFLFNV